MPRTKLENIVVLSCSLFCWFTSLSCCCKLVTLFVVAGPVLCDSSTYVCQRQDAWLFLFSDQCLAYFEPFFFAAVTFLVFLPLSSVSYFACLFCSTSPARREERGFWLISQLTSRQMHRSASKGCDESQRTVCDALWESRHLTVSEVLAASASDISQSLLCHMLACYISIFSIIKENKQWMSAVGNRG